MFLCHWVSILLINVTFDTYLANIVFCATWPLSNDQKLGATHKNWQGDKQSQSRTALQKEVREKHKQQTTLWNTVKRKNHLKI